MNIPTKKLWLFLSVSKLRHDGSGNKNIFVVIARYVESVDHLSWLSNYPHAVLNRGDQINLPNINDIRHFENVGRESFLYFDYIIKHYNNLANLTVFSQAAQRDSKADHYHFTDMDFRKTVEAFADGSLSLTPQNDGFAFLLPVCYEFRYGVASWGFDRDDHFRKLLGYVVPYPRFGPTGCFVVTRETIHRNPREYYVKLIRTLDRENSPKIGHFFEHAWPEVFHSNCSAAPTEDYHCHIGNLINPVCTKEGDKKRTRR